MIRWAFIVLVVNGSFCMAQAPKKLDYPPTKTDDTVDRLHGVQLADPYRWLERGDAPAVKDWTKQQNQFTRAYLERLPQREAISKRLEILLDTGTLSTLVPRGSNCFYTRREGKQNQPILIVRPRDSIVEKALVDPNRLSETGNLALDWWFPSRDGKFVAYGTSVNGTEQSTLKICNVETGKDEPDQITRTRACSLAWLPDSTGFYYTRYPEPGTVAQGEEKYHRRVYFHVLGSDPAKDSLEFGATLSATDWPDVQLSPDGRWLVVMVRKGWAQSDVYFRDLRQRKSPFEPLVEKIEAMFTPITRNDRIYLLTNQDAPRFKVYAVNPEKPKRIDWKLLIPEGDDVLETLAPIGESLVGLYLHRASSQLKRFDLDGKPQGEIVLPGLGSVGSLAGEASGHELFFTFQSFTQPTTVYSLDLAKSKTSPQRQLQAKSDIDPSQYQIEQVRYKSKDGTEVTLFLASKKGIKRDGRNPTLLYGYGGFTLKQTPTFNASRFVFLEQGGVLAVANLRGGGEYGEAWHQGGMLGKKQNVFDDFIAAGEYLIREKITTPERLAIMGGSNGGLLVGAALTQRPDLFRAVVCQVPLLDMVRYHHFLIAKLWIPEYGSSEDSEQFRWLYAYSPYHRVKDGTPYPAVLLTAAESDTRVDPLHARKMAARLQAATTSPHPVLLRIEADAGHGAGKSRAKLLAEQTDVWSFLFAELGMK